MSLLGQEPAKPAEPTRQTTEAPIDGAAAPVDPKVYKVGPEDIVEIQVWRETQLSGRFVVRPDGRITLPLAGELNTEGRTLDQIKEQVVELYSKYINKPEVTVSLARVGSKKYYLVGEVLRTGVFPLVVPTTVLEAINASGGFREFANRKKVTILRGQKRLKFNYDEVIKGKNVEQNIFIENGDHIIVQ